MSLRTPFAWMKRHVGFVASLFVGAAGLVASLWLTASPVLVGGSVMLASPEADAATFNSVTSTITVTFTPQCDITQTTPANVYGLTVSYTVDASSATGGNASASCNVAYSPAGDGSVALTN